MNRELNAEVEETVFGNSLIPPREYAMAKVGWRYISVTGRMFKLTTGDELPMPSGETLPQPQGTKDFNDRYTFYVAQFLGDRIAQEVDSYRLQPKPYSSDPAAAKLVKEQLHSEGYFSMVKYDPARETCRYTAMFWREDMEVAARIDAETEEEAICKAALAVREAEID